MCKHLQKESGVGTSWWKITVPSTAIKSTLPQSPFARHPALAEFSQFGRWPRRPLTATRLRASGELMGEYSIPLPFSNRSSLLQTKIDKRTVMTRFLCIDHVSCWSELLADNGAECIPKGPVVKPFQWPLHCRALVTVDYRFYRCHTRFDASSEHVYQLRPSWLKEGSPIKPGALVVAMYPFIS